MFLSIQKCLEDGVSPRLKNQRSSAQSAAKDLYA